MKKWMVGLLLLLILVACAPTEEPTKADEVAEKLREAPKETVKETVERPAEKVEQPKVTPPAEEPMVEDKADEPTTEVVSTSGEMDPQLRDLLRRADEKLKSMQYLYGGTSTGNLFLDTYLVMGDNIKIETYEEDYYVREGYYDTIYVTEGIGCCEEGSRCKSHNVDNTGIPFDVDVTLLAIPKTPYQWVKEVPANAEIVGPQTFKQRSVQFVKYMDGKNEVGMLLDITYGVPLRVVIIDENGNEVKHQFNDMLFNNLKDLDFVPPCK